MVILHGATLRFELIDVADGEPAPVRRRPAHDTLLRVVEGTVSLEVDGAERVLTIEDEARIPAGTEHRMRNQGRPAQVLYELRVPVRARRSALAR
jgi:mannose-6-phosphate isomerase-like protein (cupin superfamily)